MPPKPTVEEESIMISKLYPIPQEEIDDPSDDTYDECAFQLTSP